MWRETFFQQNQLRPDARDVSCRHRERRAEDSRTQIGSDLEGTTRRPYGGCVGYFSFNGNLDCCITIRLALIKDGKAYAGRRLGE